MRNTIVTRHLVATLVLALSACVANTDDMTDTGSDDTSSSDAAMGTDVPTQAHDTAIDTPVTPDTGTVTCTAPMHLCGTACVNLSSDTAHCGGCGVACTTGQVCNAGVCASTCTLTMCSTPTGNICVDQMTDPTHCGSCTRACPSGWICTQGACACPSNLARCGTACVNPASDATNCGSCGHACAAGQTCVNSVCTGGATCTGTGMLMCGASCVDTRSNATNCGGCAHACAAGQTCVNSVCTGGATCTGTGMLMCGASCVDTRSSTTNCGACSHACAAGQTCSAGVCTGGSTCAGGCPSGWTCQSAQCVWTDMLNAVNAARTMTHTCGMYGTFAPAPPLMWESRLASAAAGHNVVMNNTPCFSHDNTGTTPCPDGNPCTRITATGYTWMAYGENIAAGQQTIADVMTSWLNSPGHCRNIMDPTFTQFGAAEYMGSGPYGIYWTQDFGIPGSAGPSSCP